MLCVAWVSVLREGGGGGMVGQKIGVAVWRSFGRVIWLCWRVVQCGCVEEWYGVAMWEAGMVYHWLCGREVWCGTSFVGE